MRVLRDKDTRDMRPLETLKYSTASLYIMKTKTLLQVTGTLFGIIAVLHLVRALMGIPAVFGTWAVPLWLSWIAVLVAGYLSYASLTAR